MLARIQAYAKNKSLWLYVPIYLFLIYIFIGCMRFDVRTNDNPVVGLMYFIQFGVHEVSHIVAMMLPSLWVSMAGSVGEISFTMLFIVACVKYKSYFLAVFGSLWCMLAFRSVGIYISDAQEQLLPLIGPAGDASQHDWHYILGELNLIQYDNLIGGAVSVFGFAIGIWGLMFGLWLLFAMAMKKHDKTADLVDVNYLMSR